MVNFGSLTKKLQARMLTHQTGLFSGDYISALRGCCTLKFLHTLQPPKMYFKSDLGRRAASSWALPNISSCCCNRITVVDTFGVIISIMHETLTQLKRLSIDGMSPTRAP